jgi:isoleucyl-tRNA synthetase
LDYRDTLNLPKTEFPMRANLAQREPGILKRWDDSRLYERVVERNRSKPPFVLHDGPPYANGNIHPGTVLNKVLKDIVVKSRNMTGRLTEFIPGWDCHGLPIEHNVEKQGGIDKSVTPKAQIRAACREYALRFVDIQRREFRRLGGIGRWDEPYLTLRHEYEATIVRELGAFVRAGAVYRGEKPIYWCHECVTALAEAEVEYEEHRSPSIYVKFPVADDVRERLPQLGAKPAFVVIWTTTPWTIPSNLAIAFHPEHDYSLIETEQGEVLILASHLAPVVAEDVGLGATSEIARFKGAQLEGAHARHPFIDRPSLLILGEHVTLDAGTGCVHTAPGHGADDYYVGVRYGLPPYAPVDDQGRFTKDVEHFAGQVVFDTNDAVCDLIAARGLLLKRAGITHSYPHCWRSKNPVIFRSTPQWFISMEKTGLRDTALAEIGHVQWIPKWGEDRFRGMIQNRPDWCISRQRSWGVPIPSFRCTECGTSLLTAEICDHVAGVFAEHGADAWFTLPLRDLLPAGTTCPQCGGGGFGREEDILDVWFESGVSWAAVMEPVIGRIGDGNKVDLYLEGSDQHRGWFQSAMLTGVGTRGHAPYEAVLTHGFVVDGKGLKMSKSVGNYVKPDEIINQYGAEIFRLWVASEEYREDIRLSDEIIKNLADAYRKLRNTARFLLSNLYDFQPDRDAAPREAFAPIDRWAMHRLQEVVARVRRAYDAYEFHLIYFTLLEFAAADLSSFYLDVLKDRLYAEASGSPARRAAQTVLYETVRTMLTLLAPITSFTADEAWEHLPKRAGDPDSVFLVDLPSVDPSWLDEPLAAEWKLLREGRSAALRRLEEARAAKTIGHSLDAAVTVRVAADSALRPVLERHRDDLATLLIVSQAGLDVVPRDALPAETREAGVDAEVRRADGAKCARCWIYSPAVGHDAEQATLCPRCAGVMRSPLHMVAKR